MGYPENLPILYPPSLNISIDQILVTACDGTFIIKSDYKNAPEKKWYIDANPIFKQFVNDTFDNRNYAYLYNDGNMACVDSRLIWYRTNVGIPPLQDGAKAVSITLNDGWLIVVGSNKRLYISDNKFWNKITSWKLYAERRFGFTKILSFWAGSTILIALADDNKLYYNSQWGNINGRWMGIGGDYGNPNVNKTFNVIDATNNNYNDLWMIKNDGSLWYLSARDWWKGENVRQIPLPEGCTKAVAIFANGNGELGIIGENGFLYLSSKNNQYDTIIWGTGFLYQLNKKVFTADYRLSADRGLQNYWGNSTPINGGSRRIQLKNTPVSFWRRDTEFFENPCGSGGRGTQNRNNRPFGSNGYPIEAPQLIGVTNKGYGCETSVGFFSINTANGSWDLVNAEGLTHMFGDINGDGLNPNGSLKTVNKNQYKPNDINNLNALQLNIIPSQKELNGYDYFNPRYGGADPSKPTFKSISFNLPDPLAPSEIDSEIPWILCGYRNANKFVEIEVFNTYISDYLFTKIQDKTGNLRPRIDFVDRTLSNVSDRYTNLQSIIDYWKLVSNSSYVSSTTNFCKDGNLTLPWCIRACNTNDINCDNNLTAFCQTGGKGITGLVVKSKELPDNLPQQKVTQQMLDEAYPMYSRYNNTCGCNMPQEYYVNLDIMKYQNFRLKGQTEPLPFDTLTEIYQKTKSYNVIGGLPKCNTNTSCSNNTGNIRNKASENTICPSINLQICSQEAQTSVGNIELSDNATNNSGNINQSQLCVQNVITNIANKKSTVPEPSPVPISRPLPAIPQTENIDLSTENIDSSTTGLPLVDMSDPNQIRNIIKNTLPPGTTLPSNLVIPAATTTTILGQANTTTNSIVNNERLASIPKTTITTSPSISRPASSEPPPASESDQPPASESNQPPPKSNKKMIIIIVIIILILLVGGLLVFIL